MNIPSLFKSIFWVIWYVYLKKRHEKEKKILPLKLVNKYFYFFHSAPHWILYVYIYLNKVKVMAIFFHQHFGPRHWHLLLHQQRANDVPPSNMSVISLNLCSDLYRATFFWKWEKTSRNMWPDFRVTIIGAPTNSV